MFAELQQSQIERWLFNPGVYAVAGALLLVSALRGVEAMDRRYFNATINDYLYGVMYALVYFPVIGICLVAANEVVHRLLPGLEIEALALLPGWAKLALVVVIDDFLAYWSHRLRHTIRPLWHFHAIHHSQEYLNPFTTKRFHPVENLLHKVLVLTIPMAMIGASMETWYLYFLLDAAWDYFIHSNLRMKLGPLRFLVVTPQFHRVHHSRLPEHQDRNFSDRLPVWDHLFGTASRDLDAYPPTGVAGYGYAVNDGKSAPGFLSRHVQDLLHPGREIVKDLRERQKRDASPRRDGATHKS